MQYLKDIAVTGGHNLDTILRAVAEIAQRKTGASGAAVAMWKDGAMICRARSGMTAPPLGAKLSSNTGISGECLRTGKTQHCSDTENDPHVDVEVCRSLGIRSIAVLPIQGWRGINGIVEVFSTAPQTFSSADLAFLQQLAAVAERARTFQPQGATSDVTKSPVVQPAQGMLPASDRVRDVAAIFLGGRRRPFVIAGAVLAMFLIGFVIWLGWRGPAENSPTSQSIPPVVSTVEAAAVPVKDSVSNENSWAAVRPLQKGSAGIPVKMASTIEVIPQAKIRPNRPLLTAEAAAISDAPHQSGSISDNDTYSEEPPALAETQPQTSALAAAFNSSASIPQLAPSSVSKGVATGQVRRAVPPTYPAQALAMHLQGKVVLEATVFEDGTVHDISVVEGHPLLAKSAVNAVERWRYRPFQLDGRPVKTQTTITVDFKLPSDAPRR